MASLKPEYVGISLTGLLSLVAALYAGLKGRAQWEPSTQDIPQGSQRLATLASGVILVLILCFLDPHADQVAIAAVMLAGLIGTAFSFWQYHFLTSARIYDQMTIIDGEPATLRVIGADDRDLTPRAKKYRTEHPDATTQDLVNQCAGDLNAVWDKSARARMRRRYEFAYAIMVTCGTTALACAGLLFTSVLTHK